MVESHEAMRGRLLRAALGSIEQKFEWGTAVWSRRGGSRPPEYWRCGCRVDSVEGIRLPHGHPVTTAEWSTTRTSPIHSCTLRTLSSPLSGQAIYSSLPLDAQNMGFEYPWRL